MRHTGHINEKIKSTRFNKKLNRKLKMILQVISISEPKGIIHSDLADELEIDRDTLRKDMNSLLKFNFVKRENKKAPYHLTKNALSNSSFIKGLFLNSHFLSYVL